MDISLPIMNGWEVTRRLNAHPDTRIYVKIYRLTAHASRPPRQVDWNPVADDYVPPVVFYQATIKKIDELLLRKKPYDFPAEPGHTIVDYNEINRDMLARRLERKGYSLVCGGESRHELMERIKLDRSICSCSISRCRISGLESLREIRKMYSRH